jgi:hypothetical protein
MRKIDPKDCNGRPADPGSPKESGSAPAKMPAPAISSRVEKAHDHLGLGINTREIRTLAVVTRKACQRQVI